MRAYKKPNRPPCAVEGCDRPLYCRGKCVMHYNRERNGIEGGPEPMRRDPGTGTIVADGYVVLTGSTHPLAGAQGKLGVHRRVLYDAIGEGPHPCRWCGKSLTWRGPADTRINADHLDFDRLHNHPSNLVVSCLDCNTKRRAVPFAPIEACRRAGHPYTPENTRVDTSGTRTCRTCERERRVAANEETREQGRRYYAANHERILARMKAKRDADRSTA